MGAFPSTAFVRVGMDGPFLVSGNSALYSTEGVNALVANPYLESDSASYYINWGDINGGLLNNYSNAAVSAGTLLRDLKRTVVVYGSNGLKLHVFRRVQLISGSSTEGVSGSPSDVDAYKCGWVCTWSSNGYICGVPPVA